MKKRQLKKDSKVISNIFETYGYDNWIDNSVIINELKKYHKQLKRIYQNCRHKYDFKFEECDYDTIEHIMGNISYYSDRWHCCHRIYYFIKCPEWYDKLCP
jgi:hypothetical protein